MMMKREEKEMSEKEGCLSPSLLAFDKDVQAFGHKSFLPLFLPLMNQVSRCFFS